MVRDMPHMERAILVSSSGATSMPSAVFSTLILSGTVKESSPFGPFTLTVSPADRRRHVGRDWDCSFADA